MLGEGKYAVDVDLLQLCGIPLDLRESQVLTQLCHVAVVGASVDGTVSFPDRLTAKGRLLGNLTSPLETTAI